MGILCEVGTLTAKATTGTQTVSLTSSIWDGATPKALIMWWGNMLADGISDHAHFGFGMGVSSSSRVAFHNTCNNGASTSDNNLRCDNTKIITLTAAAVVYEAADLDSFGAESFVLDWTTAGGASRLFNYMVLGGDDITNIALDQIQAPEDDDTGSVNYTSIGFQPDAMISATAGLGSVLVASNQTKINIGISDFTSEYSVGMLGRDNVGTTDTNRWQVTDFVQDATYGGVKGHGAVSQHASGYTVAWDKIDYGEFYMWSLCLKGGGFKVFEGTEPTSNSTVARAVGFKPGGALFLSAGLNTTSPDAMSDDSRIGVGGWDSLNNMAFAGSLNENGQTTTDTNRIQSDDKLFLHYNHAPTLLGSVTASGDASNLFEVWTDVDGTADRDHVALVFEKPTAPEVFVTGLNDVTITDGDSTPTTTDGSDFESIDQNATAVTRTFKVANSGDANLTLGTPSVPTGFTLTEGLTTSLAAGANDTFSVRLDNSVVGIKHGDVSFSNNDSDENPFNFAISGVVQAATPAASSSITHIIVSGVSQLNTGNALVGIGGARGLGASGTLITELSSKNALDRTDHEPGASVSDLDSLYVDRFDDTEYYHGSGSFGGP